MYAHHVQNQEKKGYESKPWYFDTHLLFNYNSTTIIPDMFWSFNSFIELVTDSACGYEKGFDIHFEEEQGLLASQLGGLKLISSFLNWYL